MGGGSEPELEVSDDDDEDDDIIALPMGMVLFQGRGPGGIGLENS